MKTDFIVQTTCHQTVTNHTQSIKVDNTNSKHSTLGTSSLCGE
jgi:hypothetical protein